MKSCTTLLVGVIIGIITFFSFTSSIRANEILNDDFSSINSTNWVVNVPSGGTVDIQQNSFLHIFSQNGTASPYIYLKNVTIPENSFRINVRFMFSGPLNYGAGIVFSNKLLQNGTTTSLREGDTIFQIWPSSATTIGISSSICPLSVPSCVDTQNSTIITSVNLNTWNTFEIFSDENNSYRLYLNGSQIFITKPSSLKISNIWFGNPENRTNSTKRPEINIDYLNIFSSNNNLVRSTIIIPGLGASCLVLQQFSQV
ncbi:MAG TPA: hypothetical protein VLH94_04200 [Spirochaetia bacterium]|nr:hypothetical protein [Spirochaetia bacterium]